MVEEGEGGVGDEEEKVWLFTCHLFALNYDGNLFDMAVVGFNNLFKSLEVPGSDHHELLGGEVELRSVSGVVLDENTIILDPNKLEEGGEEEGSPFQIMEGHFHTVFNQQDEVVFFNSSLHPSLSHLTSDILALCLEKSTSRSILSNNPNTS